MKFQYVWKHSSYRVLLARYTFEILGAVLAETNKPLHDNADVLAEHEDSAIPSDTDTDNIDITEDERAQI